MIMSVNTFRRTLEPSERFCALPLTLKLAGYFSTHIQARGGGGVVEPLRPKKFETANN